VIEVVPGRMLLQFEQERILDHDPVNGYLPKLRALVPG